MIYYLVRHGQTDWNNEKRMQGHADIPLNQTGIMQMNELAERIVKEGISFDRLIASPLARAKKSAEIIAEKSGFHKDILFDEDFIETELDTYRDWLHQRSKCKKCGLTRYQTRDGVYHCPFCDNV